ncbi:MAG TPA: DUF4386 domain-containing protein [Candidatus Baltobacteraceae bacterium]|nr:DUF4386 domain-containing protein [Candidatus Baltobacteraceae bacterium]
METASTNGLTLRTAAIIAGLAYLFDPVSYAEFTLYPKLVVSDHIAQTITNISSNHGAFLMMFFFYFINFAEDVVVAWALYYLFAPVNRAVSALAALFQLVYAGIAFVGLLNLATVFHMVTQPEYLASLGTGPLHADINILLHTFRSYYSLGLILFGVHLLLIGALIVRASYVPWWIGVALIIDGGGWIVTELQPYLYPAVNVDFLFFTFFGELLFMLWLLIMGWRIQEPAATLVRVEPVLSG